MSDDEDDPEELREQVSLAGADVKVPAEIEERLHEEDEDDGQV